MGSRILAISRITQTENYEHCQGKKRKELKDNEINEENKKHFQFFF